ncbi:MAG: HYR domain-containing protein [Saprospiraceae bacterium]
MLLAFSSNLLKNWKSEFIRGICLLTFLSLLSALPGFTLLAPPANDDCANAINLVVGASCVATAGTNVEATQSIAPITCAGFTSSSALDVWYKFTAVATSQTVTVVGGSGFDAIIDVRSGACNGTNIGCADATVSGGTETVTVSGLTIGTVYLVRVYGWAGGTGTFTVCVTGAPSAPPNDDCANAINLTSGTTCVPTAGSNVNGTQSIAPITCAGFTSSSSVDVWYKFTAVATSQTVTVAGGSGFDAIIDVRSGACNGTNIGCADATVSGGTETVTVSGLTIGTVYLVRVYGWAGGTGTFTICITGTPAGPANDDCANATTLTPAATCTPTNGTTVGATQSIPAITCASFTGTADDDVWYKFVATATNHTVTVVGGASFDAVVDVRSGVCNGSNIGCADATVSGGTEIVMLSGLTIGTTYLIRVYSFSSLVSAQGTFTICVTTSGPANDNCASAVLLTPGTTCTPTNGTTVGASQTIPAITCGLFTGTADDDVWYQFVATSSNHTVIVAGSAGFDAVVDVRSGACNGSNIGCADGTASGGTETVVLSGLIPGTTYLVRVYSFGSTAGNQGAFTICITTSGPSNNDCGNATSLIPGASCTPTNGTTVGATQSIAAITCATFTGTADDDVWYQFVATSTNHTVTVVGSPVFDAVVDVRSGACNGSNIGCADATVSGGTETVVLSGLMIGTTYFVRVYSFGNTAGNQGSFTICVVSPNAAPGCPPNPTSPTNGQVSCPSATTTLSWPAVGGATSYDVYFGTSTPPPFIANTSSTTFLTNTPSNTTYFWQIRPVNSSGTATGCTIWNFVKSDVLAPVITCPANVTAFTPVGSCAATATYGAITATDNCTAPMITLVSGSTSGSSFPIGVNTIIYRATDSAGNSSTCSFTVTVIDNIAPAITCPANVTVNTAPGVCNAVATYGAIIATDNCTAPTITLVSGGTSGSTFQLGVNTIIYRATDLAGNSATCAFTVTVLDIQAPTITCPVGLTVQCASLVPSVATGSVIAADNCGPPTISFVADVISNQTCANRFTLTRYYRATDASGNSASCSQIIIVNDNTAPVITFTDPLISNLSNGGRFDVQCQGQDPNWDLPMLGANSVSVAENCGTATVVFNQVLQDQGNCPVDGYIILYRLTWTATDACGNSSSKFVYMALVDHIAPILFNIPASITVNCDEIPVPPSNVYATDECIDASLIQYSESPLTQGCQDGQIITRSWVASDQCGNKSTGIQHITLVDHKAPILEILQPELQDATDGTIIKYTCNDGGIPDFYDDLDAESVYSAPSCGNTATIKFDRNIIHSVNCKRAGFLEQQTVHWHAVDNCGNATDLTIIAQLIDTEAPVIEGVPDTACIDDPALKFVGAIDNCDNAYLYYWDVKIPNPCGSGFGVRRTYEANDGCGNFTRDTAILIPNDHKGPDMHFVNPILQNIPPGQALMIECSGQHGHYTSFGINDVSVDDDCQGVTVTFHENILESNDCTNGILATILLQWKAIDVCGNSSNLSVQANIVDHTAPVLLNFRSDITIGCRDSLPSIQAVDNCGEASLLITESIRPGVCESEYELTRTITATDQCGNVTHATQVVHVGNGNGPVIHGVIPELCDDLTIPDITAVDPCTGKNVQVAMTEQILESQCRDGMIHQRIWTATDACGNVSTAVQIIIVGDKTPPQIQIPTYSIILKYLDAPGKNYVNLSQKDIIEKLNGLNDGSVYVSDECDLQVIPQFSLKVSYSGNCDEDGYFEHRIYTWWATDVCGNSSSISFDVYIIDDVAPVLLDLPVAATIICDQLPPVQVVHASDPAQPVSVVYSQSTHPGNGTGVFDVTRTWTATDACGNVTIGTQHITWIPDTKLECEIVLPQLIECNSHNVVIASNLTGGLGAVTYEWEVLGQGFIESGQGTSEISIYVGWTEITIVLTVKDVYGCTTTCSTDIQCIDNSANPYTGDPNPADPKSLKTSDLKKGNDIDVSTKLSGLNLWPNPVNGSINISFVSQLNQKVEYRMVNFLGQSVLSDNMNAKKGPNAQHIDVSHLAEGSYLVEVKTVTGTYTKIIVIMRNN